MELEPTEAQARIASLARTAAREVLAPAADEGDRTGRFPAEAIRELGRRGLLALKVPRELGGAAAGPVGYALAIMELAQADAAVAVTVAVTNMVGEIIARYGTPAQRERCCPRLASGAWLAGSFALSEPQAGSDSGAMASRADRRGECWVLRGEKAWITSGDHAGVFVVWARTEAGARTKGITAFLVEAGTPGLRVGRREKKTGIRASSTVSLTFDELELPGSAVLGEVHGGFRVAMSALDGGRSGIAAQATGTIAAALAEGTAVARAWEGSAPEAMRFALADTRTDLCAARLLTLRAAALEEAERAFTREASMAKLFASEAAQRAVDVAVRIEGWRGRLAGGSTAARLFRDAKVQTIYEGTSEIQRLVIARDLLR